MSDLDFLTFEADFASPSFVDAYDELPLWSAMFGLLLLEHVPLQSAITALDVGCGTGFPLIELAERLGPGSHVHGIDPWSTALRRAEAKASARRTSNVTVHEGSAASMPFADSMFDLIVSNLGVNNFDDRETAMRECRRVARPGATIALTTNVQGHMREVYAAFAATLQEDGDTAALERLDAHVRHRATIDEVERLLTESGFSMTRVVEREGMMRFASGTALLNHHFIKLGFLDAWKGVAGAREDAIFSRLRKRLDDTARLHGSLHMTIPMAYVEASAS